VYPCFVSESRLMNGRRLWAATGAASSPKAAGMSKKALFTKGKINRERRNK
jgi:hypothetical protein